MDGNTCLVWLSKHGPISSLYHFNFLHLLPRHVVGKKKVINFINSKLKFKQGNTQLTVFLIQNEALAWSIKYFCVWLVFFYYASLFNKIQ